MFEAWFAKRCWPRIGESAVAGISQAGYCNQHTTDVISSDSGIGSVEFRCTSSDLACSDCSRAEPDAEVVLADSSASAIECRRLGFCDWLLEVDCDDSLSPLLPALEDNNDSVDQILNLYVLPSGEAWIFDRQFFRDASIQDESQIRLFEAWFAKRCGPESRESAVAGSPQAGD